MAEFHEKVEIYSPGSVARDGHPEDAEGPGKVTIILNNQGKIDMQKLWLDGITGNIISHDRDGHHSFSLHAKIDGFTGLWIGANKEEGAKAGKVFLRDSSGEESIILDGSSGDIFLSNADCAEDFNILDLQSAEPGTVMVLQEEGMLRQSTTAYDKKVAGVISGAGDFRPGIVLDKKRSQTNRKPVALMGKVYCKVDAQDCPIEVGDLLTTSATAGHAMKAEDQSRAFGSVIGKALRSIKHGKGLIPILIALQ